MTTIIAKVNEKNGTVDLAWDSQGTAGNKVVHCEKVAHINGQFWLGSAGDARWGNILEFAEVPRIHDHEFETGDYNPREYLAMHVIPAWIRAVKDAEESHLEKSDWSEGQALIVMAGRIFEIDGAYAVIENLEFGGVGSGSGYACGALAAGKSVERALEIASELDPYTGGELSVVKGLK